MIFTADQIVAHLVGDYVIQSHWMATQKTKNSIAAASHAFSYAIPFALITQNPYALAIIIGTHFLIDRHRIARYLVWLKNGPIAHMWLGEPGVALGPITHILRRINIIWRPITDTGYPVSTPIWLSTWLLIIVDNTIHLCCNAFAIWMFA